MSSAICVFIFQQCENGIKTGAQTMFLYFINVSKIRAFVKRLNIYSRIYYIDISPFQMNPSIFVNPLMLPKLLGVYLNQ